MDGPVSTPSTSIFSRLPPSVLNCFRLHSAQNALVHKIESSMKSSTDQTTHFVVSGGVHAHSQRLVSVFLASQANAEPSKLPPRTASPPKLASCSCDRPELQSQGGGEASNWQQPAACPAGLHPHASSSQTGLLQDVSSPHPGF